MNSAHPCMSASQGPDPILEHVKVDGTVHAAFARIRLRQQYRNASTSNVEIVYTFPAPQQATLLDVVFEMAGRRLQGQVFPREQAEAGYEDAIAGGDTAVMVERPEPGLFVMNLGNLMAGESATIEIEFAILLDWHRNHLRLSLPMTLAPRYDEEHSPLEDHQRPAANILIERAFDLDIRLSRDFLSAKVSSPTHRLSTRQDAAGIIVVLQRNSAWMDRDFVLAVEAAEAPKPFGCVVPDDGQSIFYGSVQIPASNAIAAARDVKVVLDCSGSMNGDSIALARSGVLKLLESLRPRDRFGLVAFGSQPVAWRPRMETASDIDLEAASCWVRELAADMGGTEMGAALQCALSIEGAGSECDVFLVTDGQIGRAGEVIDLARRSGHRMFVVGVGAAPQQDPLRRLAQSTGGAIEWVTPGEEVAAAIHRLFSRLAEVPISDVKFSCQSGFAWEALAGGNTVFSGDTLHFFGALRSAEDPVEVAWRMPDGRRSRARLAVSSLDSAAAAQMPRIAAGARIRQLSRLEGNLQEATRLAVKYGLITSETNYLLVMDREGARAGHVPKLRKVEDMLVAGWGGTSQMRLRTSYMPVACYVPELRASEADLSFSRKSLDLGIEELVRNANRHHASLLDPKPFELTIQSLRALGLSDEGARYLEELASRTSEKAVVLAFWAALIHGTHGQPLSRGLRRSAKLTGLPRMASDELVLTLLPWIERASSSYELPMG